MKQTYKGIEYMFFWGGIFSNWYVSDFTVNGTTYNCGEQYMMHQKALLFNDLETADKIMEECAPPEQKSLGRQVKSFSALAWEKVKYDLVKNGLREKFTQSERAKTYLLKHKHCQIVEASPKDRIWGIGYDSENAINNIDDWGENLLGKILTELAQEIK